MSTLVIRRVVMMVALVLLPLGCARTIDLNDTREYTRVLTYDGRLNPVDGAVHAEVFVLDRRPSTDFDDPVFSNIIEVTSAVGVARFTFPQAEPLGAGVAELVDLDGDGWLEFALARGSELRVVSYASGTFNYRSDKDKLFGRARIRFIDAGGRLQAVVGDAALIVPEENGELPAGVIPVTWTKAAGFARPSQCCK